VVLALGDAFERHKEIRIGGGRETFSGSAIETYGKENMIGDIMAKGV
jgi:hypothetical protein